MNAKDIFDLVTQGGALGVLVLIIWSGARRGWVWGWIFRESEERHAKTEALLRTEVDEWKAIALQGTSLARETVKHAERPPDSHMEESIRRVMADYFEAQAPPVPPRPSVRRRDPK